MQLLQCSILRKDGGQNAPASLGCFARNGGFAVTMVNVASYAVRYVVSGAKVRPSEVAGRSISRRMIARL